MPLLLLVQHCVVLDEKDVHPSRVANKSHHKLHGKSHALKECSVRMCVMPPSLNMMYPSSGRGVDVHKL